MSVVGPDLLDSPVGFLLQFDQTQVLGFILILLFILLLHSSLLLLLLLLLGLGVFPLNVAVVLGDGREDALEEVQGRGHYVFFFVSCFHCLIYKFIISI